MSYRHIIIGLFLILLAFGCTRKLSKSELADVLIDMYIYDQLFTRANLYQKQDSISIYRSVFQKHNCTENQFQASINRYGSDPKHLKEVYAMADEKIKLLKKNYGDVVEFQHKEKAMQRKMDSLYRYPPDTMYRRIFNRCLLLEYEFAIESSRTAATDSTAIEPAIAEETVEDIEAVNEKVELKRLEREIMKTPIERTKRKPIVVEEAVEIVSEKEK
ncbi:MAG: DUF4296 domain-containing protein [Prevotellaceae bacterium]|jgi:hypothetical protein|nr:DUF4296 domain-containing protein [Prevotellaceae bacterium]